MRKIYSLSAALIAALTLTVGAHAASYSISISGTDTGSLSVTTGGVGTDAGSFYLTSGGGTIDGDAVTLVGIIGSPSLAAPDTVTVNGLTYDDEFYGAGSTPFDGNGALFQDGSVYFAIFGGPNGVLEVNGTSFISSNADSITASAVTTPEPSSMILLGTGMLGLAGAVRRKIAAVA